MDIFEFAMQMEKDGEAMYRGLANKVADAGVKQILNLLADDEVKHYEAVKAIKEADQVRFKGSDILATAKNIFAQIDGKTFDLEGPQAELYRQAQEIELKSQRFYEEKANQVDDPVQRGMFLKIAEEEKRHYFLLDHIVEFVSRPQSWLENAEFTHLDEY